MTGTPQAKIILYLSKCGACGTLSAPSDLGMHFLEDAGRTRKSIALLSVCDTLEKPAAFALSPTPSRGSAADSFWTKSRHSIRKKFSGLERRKPMLGGNADINATLAHCSTFIFLWGV